jgi:hypothetical protein
MCEDCGTEETVAHYCDKCEDARERLLLNIFRVCGAGTLSEELLLTVDSKDGFKAYQNDIARLLGDYIAVTAHIQSLSVSV